jgi:hypothetical protein
MAIVKEQDGGNIVTGDILRAAFYFWLDNQIGIIDVAYQMTNAFGTVTYGDAAFDLQTAVDGQFQSLTVLAAKILGCRVTKLNGVKPFPLAGVATSTSIGSDASPANPTQVRGLVATRGPFASKIGRGRFFMPFSSASQDQNDGTPNPVYVGRLQTLANLLYVAQSFVSVGGATAATPVTFRRSNGTGTPVVAKVARAVWATQRRSGSLGRTNPPTIPL